MLEGAEPRGGKKRRGLKTNEGAIAAEQQAGLERAAAAGASLKEREKCGHLALNQNSTEYTNIDDVTHDDDAKKKNDNNKDHQRKHCEGTREAETLYDRRVEMMMADRFDPELKSTVRVNGRTKN